MIAPTVGLLMLVAFIAAVLSVMLDDLGWLGTTLTVLGSVVGTAWLLAAIFLLTGAL